MKELTVEFLRCLVLKAHELHSERDEDDFKRLLETEADKVGRAKVIYDHTIWPPSDSDACKNVVRMMFQKRRPAEYLMLDIDFRKEPQESVFGFDQGVRCSLDLWNRDLDALEAL